MKRDDKQDLTVLLANTVKWLSNHKPELPTDPDNFIVQNAMQTPDGTILVSSHVRDYKEYRDADGQWYMVDGGTDYIRRAMSAGFKDLTVMSDAPFLEVREKLLWGSYGKQGKDPLRWIRLKDMEESHIVAVLDMLENQNNPRSNWRKDMMRQELKYRVERFLPEKVDNGSVEE